MMPSMGLLGRHSGPSRCPAAAVPLAAPKAAAACTHCRLGASRRCRRAAPGRSRPAAASALQPGRKAQQAAADEGGGGLAAAARSRLEQWQSQALYWYFNQRQDAFSDLRAIALLLLACVAALCAFKVFALGEPPVDAWDEFYEGAVISFGEAFPPQTAPLPDQVGAVALYLLGISSFAVVLALVEQSVLQVYEQRVELGSAVLEAGHVLLLAWCRSQDDVSKLEVVLQQLCAAYAAQGGRTLVVLTQRKKTEMEALFASLMPPARRQGSRFVFRAGNPLTAADLRLVAADDAAVVVVMGDSATCADTSDSQVLRVLVMLDEMEAAARQEGRPRPKPGHVVAEILSTEALPLLRFVPVKPVLPLASHRLNAGRLSVLITRPVVSHLTDTLWDFTHPTALFMHSFPELAGRPMSDVCLSFDSGVVLGVLDTATGAVLVNPPGDYRLGEEDQLILLRPTALSEADVSPLPNPVSVPVGNFSAEAAVAAALQRGSERLSMPSVISCGCELPLAVPSGPPASQGCSDAEPEEQLQPPEGPPGADGRHAGAATPATPVPSLAEAAVLGAASRSSEEDGGSSSSSSGGEGLSWASMLSTAGARAAGGTAAATAAVPAAPVAGASEAGGAGSWAEDQGSCVVTSWDDPSSSSSVDAALSMLRRPGAAAQSCRIYSLAESSVQLSREGPVSVLVLGWGNTEFMAQFMLACAKGPTALPAGSQVTLANIHSREATLDAAAMAVGQPELLSGLSLRHVRLDPLRQSQLARLPGLGSVDAAIVLCDVSWRHQAPALSPTHWGNGAAAAAAAPPLANGGGALAGSVLSGSFDSPPPEVPLPPGAAGAGAGPLLAAAAAAAAEGGAGGAYGGGGGGDADVLQLDALLLRAQLNLRSVLGAAGRVDQVNIISQKVGNEEETRFEDRTRLPLGVPVNLLRYAGCLIAQLAFSPLMVLPRTLGESIDPAFVDADLLSTVGDRVSFWQLMRRAQLLDMVLLGYYQLPVAASDPIEAVMCPLGAERTERRVWNSGDNRLKFIVLKDAPTAATAAGAPSGRAAKPSPPPFDVGVAPPLGAPSPSVAARAAAAAARAAAEATASYVGGVYPVDSDWQWWMR